MSEHDNKPEPGWLDFGNPDLQALILTYRHVGQLMREGAPTSHWEALKAALIEEHTTAELANMLIGACVIHARSLAGLAPHDIGDIDA